MLPNTKAIPLLSTKTLRLVPGLLRCPTGYSYSFMHFSYFTPWSRSMLSLNTFWMSLSELPPKRQMLLAQTTGAIDSTDSSNLLSSYTHRFSEGMYISTSFDLAPLPLYPPITTINSPKATAVADCLLLFIAAIGYLIIITHTHLYFSKEKRQHWFIMATSSSPSFLPPMAYRQLPRTTAEKAYRGVIIESSNFISLSNRLKLQTVLVTYERSGLMPPSTKQCYLLTFITAQQKRGVLVNWQKECIRDCPSLITTKLSVLTTLANGSKACPKMQTLFSKCGSPSFFLTNLRLIWDANCVNALSSFMVQYSRQEGSLLSQLRCYTIEQYQMRQQPPPMRITSPLTTVPLWKERNSTVPPYPLTVDLSRLSYTTLLDLPKLVFPPKMRTEHSELGFFTASAPQNPSWRAQGSFLQLLSPGEQDQMAFVRLLLPEYPPKTQMCSPYWTTVAAARGYCMEGIAFHFLLPKSYPQQAESRPFSSEPYCLPPMTKRVWLSWMAQWAYRAFIISGSIQKEFYGSCSSLLTLTLRNLLDMVPSNIGESIVALQLTLASKSSTPPVMNPREGFCNSA